MRKEIVSTEMTGTTIYAPSSREAAERLVIEHMLRGLAAPGLSTDPAVRAAANAEAVRLNSRLKTLNEKEAAAQNGEGGN